MVDVFLMLLCLKLKGLLGLIEETVWHRRELDLLHDAMIGLPCSVHHGSIF